MKIILLIGVFWICGAAGVAQALPISDWDAMSKERQDSFIKIMVRASRNYLETANNREAEKKLKDMFGETSTLNGDQVLTTNINTVRQRTAAPGKVNDVEAAFMLTLKQNDIVVPLKELQAAGKDFKK